MGESRIDKSTSQQSGAFALGERLTIGPSADLVSSGRGKAEQSEGAPTGEMGLTEPSSRVVEGQHGPGRE